MATARTSGTEHDGVRNLETELIPGTEIMVDHDDVNFVHAHNSSSSTVLIPQPTNDRHDPLVSWSSFGACSYFPTNRIALELERQMEDCCDGHPRFLRHLEHRTRAFDCPDDSLFMELWNKSLSQIALLVSLNFGKSTY
jgi:hypothetical protein